jgi:DAK2 domain fusion protein YloV
VPATESVSALMDITHLDGRAFKKFVAAGTYFLKKYRSVLNGLNVFPVPDGDTGSNMYLTVRSALKEAHKVRNGPLSLVALAAANGSLLGARGNSGVILSQMLRGFASNVRDSDTIDTFQLSAAMRDAVAAARAALSKPVEGTILSVATAAADEAFRLSGNERDFYRLANGVLQAANSALELTPDQLPVLKEAGVVDSGGAGFCYFLEGILRFLPDATVHGTAFPRRPAPPKTFTARQHVGEHRFCTEFVLEDATLDTAPLSELLQSQGESLIVAGAAPTIKVHLHTNDPDGVFALVGGLGTLTRRKVEDMEEQHNLLVVDAPPKAFSIAAVVPGPGFDRIAKELGAEVTISIPSGANPSVRDLLVGVNAALGDTVVLLPNDTNVFLAAAELHALTRKRVIVLPTRDVVAGLAALLELGGATELPDLRAIEARVAQSRSAAVFFAGKGVKFGGIEVTQNAPAAQIGARLLTAGSLSAVVIDAVAALGGGSGGLVTLYYGGCQTERDAQRFAAEIGEHFADVQVEQYFGGQEAIEYWISCE